MRQPRCYSIGLCFAAALLMFAVPVSAAPVPVTTGLELQLDATDINADGLPDPFVNDDTLTDWKDNADGNHMESTGDPKYIVQGIQHQNGTWKPVVQFDGNDWFQVVDDLGNPDVNKLNFTTESLSIFMVAKNNGSGYFFSKMAAEGGYRLTGHGSGLRFQATDAADPHEAITVIRAHDYSQPSAMTAIYDRVPAQDTVAMYGNGSLLGSVENVNTLASISALSLPDWNVFTLGANSQYQGQQLNGDIAELLIYSRVLSDVERASVEVYLMEKWLVPEPSTFVLAIFGLIGLLGCARKRRTVRKS